jgi:hypothetical protein
VNIVRNINNALVKNRRILEGFIQDEKTTRVPKDRLIENGFHFKFMTHLYINKKGNTYYFCYDMGYLPLENDWFLIVRRKNSSQLNQAE